MANLSQANPDASAQASSSDNSGVSGGGNVAGSAVVSPTTSAMATPANSAAGPQDPDVVSDADLDVLVIRSSSLSGRLQKDASGHYIIPAPVAGGQGAGVIPAGLESYYNQKPIEVSKFTDNASGQYPGITQEKFGVIAPIDYADPSKGDTVLNVVRFTPPNSKGVIFFNPGGPGGSGTEYAYSVLSRIYSVADPHYQFLRDYTLVGWDPRGVAGSLPFTTCYTKSYHPSDGTPKSQGYNVATATTANVDKTKKEVNQCFEYTGRILGFDEAKRAEFLKHIGTVDSAKDMDLLRSVMGLDKLNYVGLSYGSRLGYEYLRQFPQSVGRVALDGIVNPQDSGIPSGDMASSNPSDDSIRENQSHYLEQGKSFQDSFEQFATWCRTQSDCPLNDPSVQPGAPGDRSDNNPGLSLATRQVQNILRILHDHPVKLSSYPVDYLHFGAASVALRGGMYTQSSWETVKKGLNAILYQQHETPEIEQFDFLKADYGYGDRSEFHGIFCADNANTAWGTNPDIERRISRMYYQNAPFVDPGAPYNTEGDVSTCAAWKFNGSLPAGVELHNLPNVLVVSTTHDPATPYKNGPILANMIHGTLLSYDGNGHVAFGRDACVTAAYDAFFNRGTVQPDGTVDGLCAFRSYVENTSGTNTPGNNNSNQPQPQPQPGTNAGNNSTVVPISNGSRKNATKTLSNTGADVTTFLALTVVLVLCAAASLTVQRKFASAR